MNPISNEIMHLRQKNISLESLITFFTVSGDLIRQETRDGATFVRCYTINNAISLVYSTYDNGTPRTILYLAMYKGTGWSQRKPLFQTTNHSSAMDKLRELC